MYCLPKIENIISSVVIEILGYKQKTTTLYNRMSHKNYYVVTDGRMDKVRYELDAHSCRNLHKK